MNKDIYDIIRPQWLFDSIVNKERVPMSKKYFFHATSERMQSEEYQDEDDDLESHSQEDMAFGMSVPPGSHVDPEVSASKNEDSEMHDWLQIGPSSNAVEIPDDDVDSVTDPDSDSDNEDNWFSIEAQQTSGAELSRMEVILCASLSGDWHSRSYTSSTPTTMSMIK